MCTKFNTFISKHYLIQLIYEKRRMKWYTKYLSTYEKPFTQVPSQVINQVKEKIKQIKNDAPLVSVVAIAHNEEKRIVSCIWSLCENECNFPIEILIVNNNSNDHTEEILKKLEITYFNETQKGPGFARQCGLNHAKGKYHICIDSDTLYPPHYISTMVQALQQKEVVCAYALWSFLPNEHYSNIGLCFYETLRDIYLRIQNLKRPELNVRGMVFAFHTETARREGFRTDIIRGEDGSLALALKKYGKLKFVTSRKARAITGYGTVSADGSLFNSFKKRAIKGMRHFTTLFHSKEKYEDEESNLIK